MIERGTMKIEYEIQIDLETIVDDIMDRLKGYYDHYDFEGDGETLRISIQHDSPCRHYHSPATILDPPEDDWTYDSIEDVDVKKIILESLKNTERVRTDVVMIDKEFKPEREEF